MKSVFKNLNQFASQMTRRDKAIALITVLALVATLTIFCVAILTIGTSEKKAAVANSDGELARQYADTAVNLVMGQIWEATRQDGGDREIWASQPGAIRKYRASGVFHSGYKLYSSSSMRVVGNELQMIQDTPPQNWAALSSQYTDLNDPVIRPRSVAGNAAGGSLYFPIVDPRAYVSSSSASVEGFWYGTFSGARPAASFDDLAARLPMPVEWLYMLRDGTLGTIQGGSGGTFAGVAGGGLPSAENPIVARVAFWTDDETCKLNINTASEPTHWSLPTFHHRRDMFWSYYQPTSHEYQRFPGHPATVALSTVLFPGTSLDTYSRLYNPGALSELSGAVQRKERIYEVIPKINGGGSMAATMPYWRFTDQDIDGDGVIDNVQNTQRAVSVAASMKERLFASVDEFIFSQRTNPTGRLLMDEGVRGNQIFQETDDIERLRFFLTAHSRMPEVTMFGTPRVAMWPIYEQSTSEASYRTGYDQLISFCCSLGRPNGSNFYYFQRKDSQSAVTDIGLNRNQALLGYLQRLLGETFPGGGSFASKYQQDATQILVEIFDYIRATNLYDGYLAPPRVSVTQKNGIFAYDNGAVYNNGPGETHNWGQYYRKRPTGYQTYTGYRMSRLRTENNDNPGARIIKEERVVDRSFPGHGQVIPSSYQGGLYRGIGRFLTVTEFGMQFVCSADGNPDKGSYRNRDSNGNVPQWPGFAGALAQANQGISGGRTALRIRPDKWNTYNGQGPAAHRKVNWVNGTRVEANNGQYDVWYSNYPPFPTANKYGTSPGASQNNHPGYAPENWNISLPINTPLAPGQKMVQGMLQIELTNVAPGNTVLNPDFSIVVEGAASWTVDEKPLFSTGAAGRLIWKSGVNIFDTSACRAVGGSVNSNGMGENRSAKAPAPRMPADPDFDLAANAGGDPHRGLRNFELTTNFFKVEGNKMTFRGNPVKVTLFVGHDTNDPTKIVQVVNIPMPTTLDLPVPHLATITSDHVGDQDSQGNTFQRRVVEAPSWWTFNYGGVIGRFRGSPANPLAASTVTVRPNVDIPQDVGVNGSRPNGRLAVYGGQDHLSYSIATSDGGVPQGGAILWGYDRNNGNYSSNLLNPIQPRADTSGDVFSDTGLVDMNDAERGDRRRGQGLEPSPDIRGTDVIFTMVPAHSDFRLLMAKSVVPPTDWKVHPKAPLLLKEQGAFFAHNLTRYNSNAEPAFDIGISAAFPNGNVNHRLVPGAVYGTEKRPDVSSEQATVDLAKRYGDFDNGPGTLRDGPWINRPDEGNAAVNWRETENDEVHRVPIAYLTEEGGDGGPQGGEDPGDQYMTPNRMVPSPGVLGSLPTGVLSGNPWRTLLFRPHTKRYTAASLNHPGGPRWAGGIDPADHYIMDLFWMPVVEPYAISEPFSTAGKVNLNYQMVPFQNYIRRATGIHAVLKGELLACVPQFEAGTYKNLPSGLKSIPVLNGEGEYKTWGTWRDYGLDTVRDQEYNSKYPVKYWHREIEVEKRSAIGASVDGTLRQFEDRFGFQGSTVANNSNFGLFRTASQICEIHLIPRRIEIASNPNVNNLKTGGDGTGATFKVTDMDRFWSNDPINQNLTARSITGDNTRERPYANIYGKITTQSNTFRIFMKAQVIRKARSVNPAEFVPGVDSITAEYRGSALIERRIDPLDPRIPDFTNSANASLDDYYRFRVLEMKRFDP